MWLCVNCKARNADEALSCYKCGQNRLSAPELAVHYRGLQAQCNAEADAMSPVVRLLPNGKLLVRHTFDYKQMRRRAAGYARSAQRFEQMVLA